MPQLNKSEAVRQRLQLLIERLVAFANYELTDAEQLESKISVRWIETESAQPKLIVKTQIRFLAALVAPTVTPKVKTHLKQDLRTLRDFLYLLEDNRDRTQGTGLWHFTLKLWHRSVEKNIIGFNHHWQQCKTEDKQTPKPSLPLTAESIEITEPSYSSDVGDRTPSHNLPTRDYGALIGRTDTRQQLLSFLSANHPAARISLVGAGGIGKTALALETAHHCLQASDFSALVFVSAKTQQFTPQGILPSYRYSRTLQDIFRTIAKTLKCSDRLAGQFERQREVVYDMLSQQRSLLIIDNLESLTEQSRQAVLSFLYELPATVKVIITSRIHVTLDIVIPLAKLTPTEGQQFIQQQTTLKAVILDEATCQSIYQQTGGMPAAMVYAIGQVAAGYSATKVLPELTQQTNDYCRYYLESTVNTLHGEPAHSLLLALSLFTDTAVEPALVYITQLSEQASTEGFAQLKQLSLVTCDNERYAMLPLARDYLASQQQSEQQRESYRQRWLGWYQQWITPHQHQNWREWHDYTLIDFEWENVQTVVEWIISTHRYSEFEQLWKGLRGYTHLRGYWNERLSWLEWWLSTLQQQHSVVPNQDSATLGALRDLGWTLALMGQPNQLNMANQYFQQAWEQCQTAEPSVQLELAIDYAVLSLFQNRLGQVAAWIETAKRLMSQNDIESVEQQIRIDYYTAQLNYRQQDYGAAKALYRKIIAAVEAAPMQQVQSSELAPQQQQIKVYSLNWLVDIELQEGNLQAAEQLLEQSWAIIQHRQDKRSQAFHQRSKARIEKLRDRPSEFQRWCQRAQASFEALGMQTQVQEMQRWLAEGT